jgi:ATP-dependent Clp protease ATP-binding subunit ClpC
VWQRFTERARRIVFFAQEEAARLWETEVGTEHLLLGLLRERDSVAGRLLESQVGVFPERIRAAVEKRVKTGPGNDGQDMRLTPEAKRVIDHSYDEARRLNNNYIGTEHLLLGLLLENDSLAAQALNETGVHLEETRREVAAMQAAEG